MAEEHVNELAAPTAAASAAREKAQRSFTVRVDVERLDALMNNIGELSIDRTQILQIGRQLAARYSDDDLVQSLSETSAHVVKVVDELQQGIMDVRMLPVGTVNGFPRMVRDLVVSHVWNRRDRGGEVCPWRPGC